MGIPPKGFGSLQVDTDTVPRTKQVRNESQGKGEDVRVPSTDTILGERLARPPWQGGVDSQFWKGVCLCRLGIYSHPQPRMKKVNRI